VNFLGDGDSMAFEQVKESRPYKDKEITKLECIGHVFFFITVQIYSFLRFSETWIFL
jgi:hypothetical protein